jgi:hypothetical protein
MQRTVIEFSLRSDANADFQSMRTVIEKSLGCKFREATLQGSDVFTTMILGMQIIFGVWRGIGAQLTFQLHGIVNDPRFLTGITCDPPLNIISIDQAIIDLLEINGAPGWRVPSKAELDAEIMFDEQNRDE